MYITNAWYTNTNEIIQRTCSLAHTAASWTTWERITNGKKTSHNKKILNENNPKQRLHVLWWRALFFFFYLLHSYILLMSFSSSVHSRYADTMWRISVNQLMIAIAIESVMRRWKLRRILTIFLFFSLSFCFLFTNPSTDANGNKINNKYAEFMTSKCSWLS